jgi:hypothetical protein
LDLEMVGLPCFVELLEIFRDSRKDSPPVWHVVGRFSTGAGLVGERGWRGWTGYGADGSGRRRRGQYRRWHVPGKSVSADHFRIEDHIGGRRRGFGVGEGRELGCRGSRATELGVGRSLGVSLGVAGAGHRRTFSS